MQVDEVYDKLGHKLYDTYKKANRDDPGLELFDKLDGTDKKIDSDGPSVELSDKNRWLWGRVLILI